MSERAGYHTHVVTIPEDYEYIPKPIHQLCDDVRAGKNPIEEQEMLSKAAHILGIPKFTCNWIRARQLALKVGIKVSLWHGILEIEGQARYPRSGQTRSAFVTEVAVKWCALAAMIQPAKDEE